MKNKISVVVFVAVLVVFFVLARTGTFGKKLENLLAGAGVAPQADALLMPDQVPDQTIAPKIVVMRDLKPLSSEEMEKLKENLSHSIDEEKWEREEERERREEESKEFHKPPVSSGDTTPPVISILSPKDGTKVSGAILLTVSANDNSSGGVLKVEYYIDSGLVGSEVSPFRYLLDTTRYINGAHTISAKAFDSSGNTTTVAIKVIFGNQTAFKNVGTNALLASAAGGVGTGNGTPPSPARIGLLPPGFPTPDTWQAWIAGGGACDCQIAIGGKSALSNVVVTLVNNNLSVWSKTTGANIKSVVVGSLIGPDNSVSDGRLLYDPNSDRFIVLGQPTTSTTISLGVSLTPDPTGAWAIYSFTTVDRGRSWLGVNKDMIVFSIDRNQAVWAIDKSVAMVGGALNNGSKATWTNLPAGQPFAPALTFDWTQNSTEYFIRWDRTLNNQVEVSKIFCQSGNSCSGKFSNNANGLAFAVVTPLVTNLQSGGNLDVPNAPETGGKSTYTTWLPSNFGLGESTMSDVVFRNGTLWFTSAVGCNGVVCPQGGSNANRTAVYFAGIDLSQVQTGGAPTLYKEWLINDSAQVPPITNYYFPSIAVSACDAVGLGFNGSSTQQNPKVYVAGGWVSDPTLTAPLVTGALPTQPFFAPAAGDWSATEADPDDSFWSSVSYPIDAHNSGVNWSDWIQHFSVPLPTTPSIFTTDLFNWPSDNLNTPNPCGLSFPTNVAVDQTNHRMFVTDTFNNRVVVYDTAAPNGNAYIAKYAIGQMDLSNKMLNSPTGAINAAGIAAGAVGLAYDSTNQRLFVTDGARVLVFNVPTNTDLSGIPASYVLGQSNFTNDTPGAPSASTFSNARGLYYDTTHGYLWVGERGNSRVMVFNVSPGTISNGMNALFVIGQPNFTTVGCNSGGLSSASLCSPSSNAITIDKTSSPWQLYIGDSLNNRVLRYDLNGITGLPLSSGIAANLVLGQPDFTHNILDWTGSGNGGGNPKNPSKYGLAYAYSVYFDPISHFLFVGNEYNCTTESTCTHNSPAANSVMVFDVTSPSNGQAADYVLGEPYFGNACIRGRLNNKSGNTGNPNCTTTTLDATTLAAPFGGFLDYLGGHTYLYATSPDDNRVFKYDLGVSTTLSALKNSNGLGSVISAMDVWGQGPHL